jgi:hypothetical protein
VVYRGGLENRFGLTANGGSNPSLSASLCLGELTVTTEVNENSGGGLRPGKLERIL